MILAQRNIPSSRTIYVKDRGDGEFDVLGTIKLKPGETLDFALELKGSQLASGTNIDSAEDPDSIGDDAAKLTFPDSVVVGTQLKFEASLAADTASDADASGEFVIHPTEDEDLIVTVPVTVGS